MSSKATLDDSPSLNRSAWILYPEANRTHPQEDGTWVSIVAHIRENSTGEVRLYQTHTILRDCEEIPSDEYQWADGNYGCDCNRGLFFGYASGLSHDDMPDTECGEGKYAVNLANAKDGKIYYSEFEPSATIREGGAPIAKESA